MPASFTDRDGRAWPLEIDFPTLAAIRKECSVDLLTQDGLAAFSKFESTEDYERACGIMYVAWREQADKHGVTDEQFGRIVGKSEIYIAALTAVNEALAVFFRGVGMTPLARMIETALRGRTKMIEMADAKLDQTTIDRLLAKSMSITERQLDDQLTSGERALDRLMRGSEPISSPPSAASSTSSTDAA